MPDSVQPHGLQPTRLLHPWDFPGKSNVMCKQGSGVGRPREQWLRAAPSQASPSLHVLLVTRGFCFSRWQGSAVHEEGEGLTSEDYSQVPSQKSVCPRGRSTVDLVTWGCGPGSENTWKEARERKTVEVKSWVKADGTPEGNGVPNAERPRYPGPLFIRTRCPDTSSKATLWVKAQHEGALPPPCIVRKDPRVPHTARRGA